MLLNEGASDVVFKTGIGLMTGYKTLFGGFGLGLGVLDLDILRSYGLQNILILQPIKSYDQVFQIVLLIAVKYW